MNKMERLGLLRNFTPQTWFYFCKMEASHDKEVMISRQDLSLKLDLTPQTMGKYLATWEAHGLVQQIDGGFVITQLDGQASNATADPVVREFKNACDVINFWCDLYKTQYGQTYSISNWAATQANVKKLLRYTDDEIRSTFQAILSLYGKNWANPKYPRPTLGAVCSWLFVQAEPFLLLSLQEHSQRSQLPM